MALLTYVLITIVSLYLIGRRECFHSIFSNRIIKQYHSFYHSLFYSSYYSQKHSLYSQVNQNIDDFKTIFSIGNVNVPIESSASFLQQWALESINNLGVGMKATKHPQGVIITFKPAPGSHLDIFAFSDKLSSTINSHGSGNNIDSNNSSSSSSIDSSSSFHDLLIKVRLVMKDGSTKQVQSLLTMAAENIIESLTTHIQMEMISPPKSFPSKSIPPIENRFTMSTDKSTIQSNPSNQKLSDELDFSIRKQIEDLRESIPAMRNFKIIEIDEDSEEIMKFDKKSKVMDLETLKKMSTPPTIEDIQKMWKEVPINTTTTATAATTTTTTTATTTIIDDGKMESKPMETATTVLSSTTNDVAVDIMEKPESVSLSVSEQLHEESIIDDVVDSNDRYSIISSSLSSSLLSSTSESNVERKELYTWLGLMDRNDRKLVINCLQRWKDKFTGRGTGIEAIDILNGVNISFALNSFNYLIIEITESSHNSSSLSPRSSPSTILLSTLYNHSIHTEESSLLARAINHLESSVVKEMSQIQVTIQMDEKSQPKKIFTNEKFNTNTENLRYDGFASDQEFISYVKKVLTTTTASLRSNIDSRSKEDIVTQLKIPLADYIQTLDSSAILDDDIEPSMTQTPTSKSLHSTNSRTDDDDDDDDVKSTSFPKSSSSSSSSMSRKRDPRLMEAAADIGIKLESFENRGLEEQAIKELNDMIKNSQQQGFLSVLSTYRNNSFHNNPMMGNERNETVNMNMTMNGSLTDSLDDIIHEGLTVTKVTWQSMLNRTGFDHKEDLSQSTKTLPINLKAGGLKGGIDIFEGPKPYLTGSDEVDTRKGENSTDIPSPDAMTLTMDKKRLDMLLVELQRSPPEYHTDIINSYKELLLSNNMIYLLMKANTTEITYDLRLLYGKISKQASQATSEFVELMQQESMKHLQTIYDICDIAQQYQHQELTFLERLDYLKPRFDTSLLLYLTYAIDEEKDMLRRKGSDPSRYPSKWLLILQLIHQGVLAEFEQRYDRVLEPLLLTIRFEPRELRRTLFQRFVNITAPIDLQYMRTLAINMIESINMNMKKNSEYVEKEIHNKLIDLEEDVHQYLSEEYIETKMKEFTDTAKSEGVQVIVTHRNPLVRNELELYEELQRQGGRIEVPGGYQGGVSTSILDRK